MNAVMQALPATLNVLVDAFLDHLQARGKAQNTLLAYANDLRNFEAFAARFDTTLVQLISSPLVNRWLDYGLLHLNWKPRTAHRKLETLRSFLRWCRAERLIQHDPTEGIRVSFRPRRVIAPEMEPLKEVIARIGRTGWEDIRDRAMLMLMLDAALRAGEVVRLDVAPPGDVPPPHWVNFNARRVYVHPKGGTADEADVVGLEEQTVEAVKDWMRARPMAAAEGETALFVNQHGRRLSRQGLYLVVRARGKAAGLPRLHPHLFRHRRIGEVVEKLGLKIGSAQARHKHEATTANVYGAHAAEVNRHAVRTMAPLGDIACNA